MSGKKTVIHLYIQGNCGNQFFQYAFARTIQERLNADLIINYHFIHNNPKMWEGSDNLLKYFNVTPYKYESRLGFGGGIFKTIRFVRNIFRLKDFYPRTYRALVRWAKILPLFGVFYFDAAYYPFKVYQRGHIYIFGYYESPQYFAEIDEKIKQELVPIENGLSQNEYLMETIENRNSVCVTIKRRDLCNSRTSSIYNYSVDYFYTAIEYMKLNVTNPVFIIFSDNIEWCRQNLKIDGEVLYETDNNPIWEKIRLMSSCKHFIIHNSTFSWWAQHLSTNKDRIVIAPKKWMLRNDQPIDIYEEDWVYIDANGNISSEHE